ncbi:GNAT family N-acetyltransferase [Isobaculum melis]|uniref:Aminoglycoside 6'-N-acetyltransferase I n=1 Tax=Isobaculum melis TaxID=142588 RepID=A0A1H9SVA7_9LACT|nr:GNAT family N-acetyltransferase [Isobaculum melis]SER88940.1 aminoglycoside 6'-N-acetyltransferase I [Isobaculum melis]
MEKITCTTWNNHYLDEAIQLYLDVFTKDPWNDDITYDDITSYFERLLHMNTFEGYIALSESGALLAVSVGFIRPWYKGIEYHLDSFYMASDYQGKGVGTVFLNAIKKALCQKNIPSIVLDTDMGYPAEYFYRKNGFEQSENGVTLYGSTKNPS